MMPDEDGSDPRPTLSEAFMSSRLGLATVFDHSPDVVLVSTSDGRIVHANPEASRTLGLDGGEHGPPDEPTVDAVVVPTPPTTLTDILSAVQLHGTWLGRTELVHHLTGERLAVSTSAFAVRGHDDDSSLVVSIHRDASAQNADDHLLQKALDASTFRASEQRVVAELSRLALRGRLDDLLSAATDAVVTLYGARCAVITRAHDLPATLEIVAATGDDAPHDLCATGPSSITAFASRSATRIVWSGDAHESRFDVAALVAGGVDNAVAVPIDGTGQPWGVLTVLGVDSRYLSSATGSSVPIIDITTAGPPILVPDNPMLDTGALDTVSDVVSAAVHRVGVESELRYRSLRDPLTGLPNRALAYDRIESAVERGVAKATTTAVMLIDLDDFKSINDGLGHEAGDSALVSIGNRLTRASRPGDTVARLGGDEFVAVCENLSGPEESIAVAQAYADAVRAAIVVDGNELRITASIGVALADDTVPGNELIRRADVAMYRAKDTGRGNVAVFDTDDREHRRNQLALSADLRSALDSQILTLAYQPIFDIATGRITAVEALARWQHPTLGSVSPETFVRIAERTGQINTLGLWALHTACVQATEWQAISDVGVRVNVSALQLRQPEFVASVARILASSGLPVGRLGLEITETVWLADTAQVRDALTELHEMGVSILLDDLGSGHSSVTYLSRYPVIEAFKIDQTYIQAMPGKQPEAIVSAIVSLAHAFDVAVVGEGVESQAQFDRLRDSGCDLAQGFWLAHPASANEVTSMLLERRAG
ncbi:EAL domain-containing protein [Rhodococcus sp. BP-241]|uniref:sensor domain-containing protein n=1 Tax=Rhodococcus sp. BP-241 TaxID=2739441 RepID=UPI001C9BA4BE|nr:EAL domain-containing protein [Rhodococcus sp. BP-241]MBY6708467.1 EAL domain-containing protein [Rhodococcus sp. BP-241]